MTDDSRVTLDPFGCGCLILGLSVGLCVVIAAAGIGWWMVRGTYGYFFGGG
jgi:hypothetical protein